MHAIFSKKSNELWPASTTLYMLMLFIGITKINNIIFNINVNAIVLSLCRWMHRSLREYKLTLYFTY